MPMFEELKKQVLVNSKNILTPHLDLDFDRDVNFLRLYKVIDQRIQPHPVPGLNKSPTIIYFQNIQI